MYQLCFLQAPPKAVPKTIENQRVYDETTVDPDDEEVALLENVYSSFKNILLLNKIILLAVLCQSSLINNCGLGKNICSCCAQVRIAGPLIQKCSYGWMYCGYTVL